MEKLKNVIDELLDRCDEWGEDTSYDRGYKDGFHDALVNIMREMNIEMEESYCD